MNYSLRYISVSHRTASVSQRDDYQISEEEKNGFLRHTCSTFPDIKGLLVLVTCNRTEIYFESTSTSAVTLRDFVISLKATSSGKTTQQLFEYSDSTEDTLRQLLEVSSGLASSILGDAEIIHQIRKLMNFQWPTDYWVLYWNVPCKRCLKATNA